MTDPHGPDREARPDRSRRFQYGITAVLVLHVVAAVAMGIWRGCGAARVFAAGLIGVGLLFMVVFALAAE